MDKPGKKIAELRVVDLREILDKRGLDKGGNKATLIERLSKSLTDEGLDPSTYVHTLDDNGDVLNDSTLSEASQGDTADASESKGSINEEFVEDADVEKDPGYMSHSSEPFGESSSFQDGEKMVEVDSLAVDQIEAEDAPREDDVSAENANSDTDQNALVDDSEHAGDDEIFDSVQSAERDIVDSSTAATHDIPTATEAADTTTEVEETAGENTSKPGAGSALDTDGTFVVHIDESDTNLDYDLNVEKPEERDAPTPTKDESMDVDACDIVQSSGDASAVKESENVKEAISSSVQASKSLTENRSEAPKKDSKELASSQNLWISGLSSLTRATDLKHLFSKHGKVIGAKVVTNANRPGAKCYGYVTMSSAEEAAKCIQNLHRTELHQRMISVGRAKSDPCDQARAAAARKPTIDENRPSPSSYRSEDKHRHSERHRPRSAITGPDAKKDEELGKDVEKKSEEKVEKSEAERKADEYLEREKRRVRALERRSREDDYRRRNVLMKEKRDLAEQQRRVRMEEERLNREREKMRIEREKVRIEEMKLDSLQGERSRLENQLIELRQRVDREREELKRVETLRLEEMRRSTVVKRSYETSNASRNSSGGRYDDGWESKRPAQADRYTAVNVDRRSSVAVSSDRGSSYTDRRVADLDRRPASVKDVGVDRGSGRSEDRYSSRSSGERREYVPSDRSRDVSSRSGSDSRGVSRSYHESSSSRRSGGTSDRSWNGSSGGPSLLSGPSSELFSGAAVQAAGMMMSAAMSRGSGTSNGASSRYSGGSGTGSGSGYGGGRRY
ncbi:scaffold attachment factor B1-like isoform X2 [Watersipora subatra]|uniref:scaffold attachment factor B1-like isoform X2 n=1 Tax=Watersipora subatra TaxID=2589382 RepID=UPI00355B4040